MMKCPECGQEKHYFLTATKTFLCIGCGHQFAMDGEEE